ncbi:MAG: hypothetical protein HWE10_03815 [Gammaproteobacteria bacterium]|nr:hypothetical protein [Gammaproteobacteria bacterium]
MIEDTLENGEEITSQEQLEEVVSQIDVNEVLQAAAIIKAVVDEGKPLPEGTNTVLELVRNKEVKDQFVEDLLEEDPNFIDDIVQDILDDPVLVPEDNSFDVAQKFFAVKLGDYQNLTSEVINLDDDSTGTWSTFYGSFDVTWQKVDKKYQVQFEDNAFIRTVCNDEGDIEVCRDGYLKSAVINKLPHSGADT